MKNIYKILLTIALLIVATSVAAAAVTFPINGGTGSSVIPTYGLIPVGNAGGTYTPTATTTPGAFSQWVTSGSDIYYNTGNVGVGNTNPLSKLQVGATTGGTFRVSSDGIFEHYYSTEPNPRASVGRDLINSGGYLGFTFDGNGSINAVGSGIGIPAARQLGFYTSNSTALTERARIDSLGNFGIGSTTSWGLLSVNPNGIAGPAFVVGSSTATKFAIANSGFVGVGTGTPQALLHITRSDSSYFEGVRVSNDNTSFIGSLSLWTGNDGAEESVSLGSIPVSSGNGITAMTCQHAGRGCAVIDSFGGVVGIHQRTVAGGYLGNVFTVSAGNVGVGSTTPSQKLTVAGGTTGNIEVDPSATIGSVTGFKLSGTAGQIDYGIKKSNSSNRFAGMTIAETGGATGEGQVKIYTDKEGSSFSKLSTIFDGSGNVGIGTSTPSQVLSVQGNGLISGNLTAANIIATGTMTVGNLTSTNVGSTTCSTPAGLLVNCAGTNTTYALMATESKAAPNDAATYYFGLGAFAYSGVENMSKIYIPRAGTIKSAYITFITSGTIGSSETSSIYVRKNATTDYLISSAVVNNNGLSTPSDVSNTGMSVPVVAGDYVEVKWVTPTWVTNPTNVDVHVMLYVES